MCVCLEGLMDLGGNVELFSVMCGLGGNAGYFKSDLLQGCAIKKHDEDKVLDHSVPQALWPLDVKELAPLPFLMGCSQLHVGLGLVSEPVEQSCAHSLFLEDPLTSPRSLYV